MVMVFVDTIPASAGAAEAHKAGIAAPEPLAGSGVALEPCAALGALEPAPAMAPSPMMRRITFTWTGNSSDPDYWNEAANWSGMGGACTFPCSTSDDATFSTCGFYVYFDASRTIDDLTISLNSD